jgi:hypothetical protein
MKSRMMRLEGHVVLVGDMNNAYKILDRNPEWKTPLRRPRRRWIYNIRRI